MMPIKCFVIEPSGRTKHVEFDGGKSSAEWTIWQRADTKEELGTMGDIPPGAMWRATWLEDLGSGWWKGPDGQVWIVKTPGGDWNIDSRASNCTMKDDNAHRCWVRHGTPPELTVDKNGLTCNAGAGSIQAGNWHGFLRNGFLVE